MKYNINFLPARYGDCIVVEYGTADKNSYILIDGGTGGTKAHIEEFFEKIPKEKRVIELLVITHIDRDHIEGVLNLLEEELLICEIKSVWFNGWKHLQPNPSVEPFGAVQGERLTAAILKHRIPWNSHFGGGAVVVPKEGSLPMIRLDGGMELTLLSPMKQNLMNLRRDWENEVRKAGLDPGFGEIPAAINTGNAEAFGVPEIPDVETLKNQKFKEDTSSANGSSIAFAAAYQGKAVLFTGDSFPGIISSSLNRLEESIEFDLVKLSHHGSKSNTSPDLMKQVDCRNFVISTSGTMYHHPDAVTIARLLTLKSNINITFNYKSQDNRIWELLSLQDRYGYTTTYPENEGVTVTLHN
ncbi:MBL fold metallo-hydrolase [Flavobacterium sp. N502536]|uniref:MBL fold metallo-hydrolase n=1 Tax=Flavobacterium sp. N502536 TaxID=2986837 RepID=UPI00222321D8|nr:MBL fold metallo-hydrolase [Flavobacterium sp. N502536]